MSHGFGTPDRAPAAPFSTITRRQRLAALGASVLVTMALLAVNLLLVASYTSAAGIELR